MNLVRPLRSKAARAAMAGALVLGVVGGVVLPRIGAQALPGVNTLSINDVSLNEGSGGGATSFTFTVTMNVAATSDVTVNYVTGGGTATGGVNSTLPNDYKNAAGTLTFTPGQTTKTITVEVGADIAPEASETFNVTLSQGNNNSTIADGTGVGTIQNDDGSQPVASVSAPSITETEADQTVNFTVALSAPAAQTTTVQYATSGATASSGSDFTSESGTITFDPGQSSKTEGIVIKGDTLDEADETFSFTLSSPTNATLSPTNSAATATIVDNDAPPSLTIADTSATEGAQSSTATMNFTVTLSAASARAISVSYATANSTSTPNATAGVDYLATSQILTIPAGQTTGTIPVTVVGDNQDEPNEFVDVVLSSPQNVTISDGTAIGTIDDDDGTPLITVGNASVTEGNAGTTNAVVTFSLSAASGQTVSVDYATATGASDGTATAVEDFDAQSGTVTFPAGTTSVTKTFVVKGDTLDEATETFSVKLSNVQPSSGATVSSTPGVVTINDDDAQSAVTINDVTANEGNAGVTQFKFTLTLNRASGKAISVNAATAAPPSAPTATSSVDYQATSGTVTFPAGTITQEFVVNVIGETVDEQNERFGVVLSGGVNVSVPANEAGLGTITNDDGGPSIVIVPPSSPVDEGNSPTAGNPIAFTVTLNGPDTQKSVTVAYATQDRSAVSGAGTPVGAQPDYNAASGTLTFAPGERTKTITVTTIGDTLAEPDEVFDVVLSAPTNATIGTGTATGQIANDDPTGAIPLVSVTNAADASEGGNHVFTFVVSGTRTQTITVNYSTGDGPSTGSAAGAVQPADYPKSTGTVTFTTTDPTTKNVTIVSVNDTVDEDDEFFHMDITSAGNATINDGSADAKILDNDAAPTVTIEDKAIAENVGSGTGSLNVTLSAASAKTVTVKYATADGAAKQPGDYTSATGTLTFAPGETTKAVNLGVANDALDEVDETFDVVLTDPTNATLATKDTGIVTITDDDAAPTVSIGQTPAVTEGTGAVPSKLAFPVMLSAASGKTVTVVVTPTNGTATQPGDYTAGAITVTFAPGETTKAAEVPVIADAVDEDNESVTATMSAPTNATLAAPVTSTGTITDDDAAPTVSIATPVVVGEAAGKATFTVTLSNPSSKAITVKVATADVTAKTPADYTALAANTTVSFAAGETSKTVEVTVAQDTLDEADETFTATLSAPTNATLGSPSSATATITDDDGSPTITINSASAPEGDVVTFTVTLSAASGRDVTVKATTANGTATAGSDYTALSALVITVPAGQTTKSFTVEVLDDEADEADETFTVTLSDPTNATLTTTKTGTGTILDGTAGAHITTGAGTGGGMHVRDFNPDGTATAVSFLAGSEQNGVRVARGDVDGDGIDEIITGAGPGGSSLVSVFDAAGNFLVQTAPYGTGFRGGVFVAAADINGDGSDEIITAAGSGGGPHVRTYTYSQPANSPAALAGSAGFYAYAADFGGGVTVGGGDLNGDGTDEIITGMASQGSQVRSFSYNGTGAATKGVEINPYAGFTGGAFAAAGDLTGDGNAEIVTATGPGGGGDPHLRTFTPAGVAIGGGVYAYNVGFRGGFSVAVGDLNGDGNAEIVTGAGPSGGPHVKVWNANLQQQGPGFFAYGSNFTGGVWVAVGTS